MIEKTLYISDLDGTLLGNDSRLSSFSAERVRRAIALGAAFTIATSRSDVFWVKQALGQLDLSLPVILMNGALVYDLSQERVVKANALAKDRAQQIFGELFDAQCGCVIYSLNNGVLSTQLLYSQNKQLDAEYKALLGTTLEPKIIAQNPQPDLENVIFISSIATDENKDAVIQRLRSVFDVNIECYKSNINNLWFIEIAHQHSNKGSAAQFLKQKYGFDKMICFGDNDNDVSLFVAADEGYAVQNASRKIIPLASSIIASNADNGVALWLEKELGI